MLHQLDNLSIAGIDKRDILTEDELQRYINHRNRQAQLQSQLRIIACALVILRAILHADHNRQRQRKAQREHINQRGEVQRRLMRRDNLRAELRHEQRHNTKNTRLHKNRNAHRHAQAQIILQPAGLRLHYAQHSKLLERLQTRNDIGIQKQQQPEGDARRHACTNTAQARHAQLAKNQHVVQQSVQRQRQHINLHRQMRIAKRINQAAQRRNQEKGNNADAYAHHIPQRHIINSRLQSHALQKMRQKGYASRQHQHRKGQRQKQTMTHHYADFFALISTEQVRHQRHCRHQNTAHAGLHRHPDIAANRSTGEVDIACLT